MKRLNKVPPGSYVEYLGHTHIVTEVNYSGPPYRPIYESVGILTLGEWSAVAPDIRGGFLLCLTVNRMSGALIYPDKNGNFPMVEVVKIKVDILEKED